MDTLAQKLMTLRGRIEDSKVPTAIFGSIATLPQSIINRPNIRIGLWPCTSSDLPVEAAMGVWMVYAALLERWRDIEVYRLVARPGETLDEAWQPSHSQFGVDDWHVEMLDENVAIWGEMKLLADGQWHFTISIENDLDEDSDVHTLTHSASSWSSLLLAMPALAHQTAELLEATQLSEIDPVYAVHTPDEALLQPLLTQFFHWERSLLAWLWGAGWQASEFTTAFTELQAAGQALGDDFSAWIVSKAVERALLPGFSAFSAVAQESIASTLAAFSTSRLPAVIIGRALFRAGNTEESYALLMTEVEQHPHAALSWLCLGDLYRGSGLFVESVNAFQSALEHDAVDHAIYHHYGNTLLVADQYQQDIDEFILIDPDDYDDDFILWEAIEAYEEALKLKPDDLRSLYRQCIQLLELDTDRFWDQFEQLVTLDEKGEQVRDVIGALYMLDDPEPGLAILQEAFEAHPERLDLRLNYAAMLIENDEAATALPLLETALATNEDVLVRSDIEQLILTAHHPDFEERFGEISSVVNAGNRPEMENMAFLEDVCEKAPTFTAGSILLARAYLRWEDDEAAMETLLDAQKLLPDDPDILDMLAEQLWLAGEQDVAFEYLNRGLQNHPNHVPLLLRTGRYLFDNGQYDDARLYLSRADVIAPRDPAVEETRRYIAAQVAAHQDEDEPEDESSES